MQRTDRITQSQGLSTYRSALFAFSRHWVFELPAREARALGFILGRTAAYCKPAEVIPHRHFIHGIDNVQCGLGMSARTLGAALEGLIDRGLIRRRRWRRPDGPAGAFLYEPVWQLIARPVDRSALPIEWNERDRHANALKGSYAFIESTNMLLQSSVQLCTRWVGALTTKSSLAAMAVVIQSIVRYNRTDGYLSDRVLETACRGRLSVRSFYNGLARLKEIGAVSWETVKNAAGLTIRRAYVALDRLLGVDMESKLKRPKKQRGRKIKGLKGREGTAKVTTTPLQKRTLRNHVDSKRPGSTDDAAAPHRQESRTERARKRARRAAELADRLLHRIDQIKAANEERRQKRAKEAAERLTMKTFSALWQETLRRHFPDHKPSAVNRTEWGMLKRNLEANPIPVPMPEFLDWAIAQWPVLRTTEFKWEARYWMKPYPTVYAFSRLIRKFVDEHRQMVERQKGVAINVDTILVEYGQLKEDNERLREQLESLRAQVQRMSLDEFRRRVNKDEVLLLAERVERLRRQLASAKHREEEYARLLRQHAPEQFDAYLLEDLPDELDFNKGDRGV